MPNDLENASGKPYQKQTVNQQMYKSSLTPIPRKDIQH